MKDFPDDIQTAEPPAEASAEGPTGARKLYQALHSQHQDELERRIHSNARLAEEICKIIEPKSVVDVGCGIGLLLTQFQTRGATVQGVEGDWLDPANAVLGAEHYIRHDLETPLALDAKFDLAISIEVAEHLAPARADGFVDDLCALSNLVVFSAAIPGQGGRGHKNEQWQGYWAEKFESRGFLTHDPIRPALRFDDEMFQWFRQNVLVFAKKGTKVQRDLADSRIAPAMTNMILPFFHERALKKLRRKLRIARKSGG